MAIDQTAKKQKLAKDVVTQVTAFVRAHEALIDLQDQVLSSGVVFNDADFAVDGLKHLDAQTFSAINASVTAVETLLRQNSAVHWKAYTKLIA